MDDKVEETSTLTNQVSVRIRHGVGSLEILIFVVFAAKTLSDTIIVNLLERSTCLVILNLSESNCTASMSVELVDELQQSATTLIMIRSIIEAFVPSMLSLFIGPWSDTNGRRPLLLYSLVGYTVSALMWSVFALPIRIDPRFFLLASIPVALGGGYVTFFLALYCYISDRTEPQYRAVRMCWLEAGCLSGMLLSTLVTPYLLNTSEQYGFSVVFTTSALFLFISFLFTLFYIEESVNIVESQRKTLFRVDHVVEVFSTCFKYRPNRARPILMCLIFNLVLYIVLFDGEMKILYLFLQNTFNWDLFDYTRFTSVVISILGPSVVFSTWFLTSFLKLPDLPVIFIATLCMVMKALMQAVATSDYFFCIANLFSIITVVVMPVSRSIFSKLFTSEELGKVFAFTSFVEATAPLAGAPLYATLYKLTMSTHPFAVFYLSLGLACASAFLAGTAVLLHWFGRGGEPDSPPLLDDTVNEDNCTVQS